MAKHNTKQIATPTTTPSTTPAVAQASNPLLAQPYKLGKAYNVRPNTVSDNAATWALLTKVLADNGGVATRAQLQGAASGRNHVNMVGYCIRRGWLTPADAAPAPTQQ